MSRPYSPLSSASSRPISNRLFSVDAFVRSETSLLFDDENDENGLSEEQLRDLYDTEEIQRFLQLFTAYVTEVQVPETPQAIPPSAADAASTAARPSEDGEWTPVLTAGSGVEYFPATSPPVVPKPQIYNGISEEIACRFIVPFLPPARPPPAPFTLGRLRLACQRLYLVALPTYGPFFVNLKNLSTWEDPWMSSIYCTIYWTLWWHNLLAPTLILRILFSLLRKRLYPYPSLEELRKHRAEIEDAEEFGAQVTARLSASSSGMTEMWRLLRLLDQSKKNKVKKGLKEKARDKGLMSPTDSREDQSQLESDVTVLDDPDDTQAATDSKVLGLQIMDEISDLHERIHNIFIWRKPTSSQKYGIALFGIFLTTLLPAQYISKLVFFVLGCLFWHAVPIVAALPPSERQRLPPAFDDVPTDAEYAMQLISQRVAAGLDIKPGKLNKKRKQNTQDNLPRANEGLGHKSTMSEPSLPSVETKRKGIFGNSPVQDFKKLASGKGWPIPEAWPPRNPFIQAAVSIAQPQGNMDTHTFPCQHSSAPGLITLTPKALFFTPLMSQNAKLIVPLSAVKGVKKAGLLKGVQVRWTDPTDPNKEQREEKFHWVSNRDELFARLVGFDGQRWMKAIETLRVNLRPYKDLILGFLVLPFLAALMFFSPELLAKRDSGFGLLWLAATLGSKSAFKKLPRRSVLSADISQLCDLISEPAEPLALRLSSNLMFGVVRVYKVKQEIFMTDVTNCVTSLKKVVQDLHNSAAQEGQIQMANPVARLSAVTIIPNPHAAHVLDYEAFVADWDAYLNIGADTTLGSDPTATEDLDEDIDPTQKKKRTKPLPRDLPTTETVRKGAHTLDEHHEHLLSASYDMSFNASGNAGGGDPSSSQFGGGFDNFNFFSDHLEAGDGFGLGLGDDLAKELGWGVSPVKSVRGSDRNSKGRNSDLNFENENFLNMADNDFNFNADDMPMMHVDPYDQPAANDEQRGGTPRTNPPSRQKGDRKENSMGLASRTGSVAPPSQSMALSPATSFSRQLLSQDAEQFVPLRDITATERNRENQMEPSKKLKRTRLLLDARTELTDEELKIARAKYLQSQKLQRRALLQKRLEKESGKIVEDMIWGVPKGMQALELVDFWQENFKVQVEARSGALKIHEADADDVDSPRPKRRKTGPKIFKAGEEEAPFWGGEQHPQPAADMDTNMDWVYETGVLVDDAAAFRLSSEEPGQARRLSRSGSAVGANLGFDMDQQIRGSGSQKSSLFPWDHAGPSSSSGQAPAGSDHAIGHVDVRLRSASISRRDSSLAPSQRGSILAGMNFSPAPGRGSQILGEDFAFDVDNVPIPEETQPETQKSEINLATLQKNSNNFLEYVKMQHQTLANPADHLSFDTVVPKLTSTRHVATAAFYHCLVLATKNLIRLEQPEPYDSVLIDII